MSDGQPELPRPRVAHRLEYAGFRAILAATNALPAETAERIGARIAARGWSPLRIRRHHVEEHLRIAFPEQTQEWRDRVGAACYAHIGREMVAMMRLSQLSREQLLARTETVGLEEAVARYRGSGSGVVIIGGHFGNWELGAAMIAARGYPVSMVAQRQSNLLFDRHLVAARQRLGIDVIERSRASKLALRVLRNRGAVVFGADQNAGRSGIFVPFFGKLASTHRGPALMAVRTNSPMFVALPIRLPSGSYRLTLDEVRTERTGDVDVDVQRLTEDFTARLEAAIRENPEQYLWHHRRWKTRPPEEIGSGAA